MELPVLLEVNVAGEASKYGFHPAELSAAVDAIAALPGLRIEGLMTMAPLVTDPELARPTFRSLAQLRAELAQRYPAIDLASPVHGHDGRFRGRDRGRRDAGAYRPRAFWRATIGVTLC